MEFDVAIIGGGPAGSTAGSLLKKYMPALRVVILEKERFPREHVGESQLPLISVILDEMGCWESVEAANFPIKVGATYTWGADPRPWDFNFVNPEDFQSVERPARFEGQRRLTAFQVDRAVYDDILLTHAARLGCDVRQEAIVRSVLPDGNRVAGLTVEHAGSEPETICARWYIDASGNAGILRRAMGVGTTGPQTLRNVAFWDYWTNAEWAEEIGVGGTRIQIRSLPYGWLWFIPLGPTRTSIGFVCHSDYYKELDASPDDLYRRAIHDEPLVAHLIENATRQGPVRTTRDWSFLSETIVGENWFLTGESAGFADPILSAGMTLAQTSARDAAYTIMELDRGEHDPAWLRSRFDERNRRSIEHHIRFALYWYSANGLQSDLEEYTQEIARSAGIRLNPKDAFRWISDGAFTTEMVGSPAIGSFDITSIRDLTNRFAPASRRQKWMIDGHSVFQLNTHNAQQGFVGDLSDGRIERVPCLIKGGRKLPIHEFYGVAYQALTQTSDAETFLTLTRNQLEMIFPREHIAFAQSRILEALESMALDGWVLCKTNKKRPPLVMEAGARTIKTKG